MEHSLLTIVLAFIEGIGLILSPCILPILPIILSGSLDGQNSRPFGIISGFILSFALFTLFSKTLVHYIRIDLNLLRDISFGLLILLGIIMLSTFLSEKFGALTQRLARMGTLGTPSSQENGFTSGFVFGSLIGLIWTPCAGPILAAVLIQSVLQQTTLGSFFVLLAFGLGAGIPMLCIALFGRVLVSKLAFLKSHTILLRRILGMIIIISVGWIILSERFPLGVATIKTPEATALIHNNSPYPAPPIEGITAWINSPPLQINQLKNKVILIDFWDYSCINCIRTLPYLKDWYQKYRDKGLVIIGVHAPEFEFEKDYNNVKKSAEKFGLTYPIALDNQFVTWRNYHNQYWPAHYLIDQKGNVIYYHFGEGSYDIMENNIRVLLGITGTTTPSKPYEPPALFSYQTPETYLGYARANSFSSPEEVSKNHSAHYNFPMVISINTWALWGQWTILSDKIIANERLAAIKIRFHAKHVFVVMGSTTGKTIPVRLSFNGEAVITEKGADVQRSEILVSQHALYEALSLPDAETGILELTTTEPGLEVYTFTFG